MTKKEYLYPLWLRLWHWFNALLFVALIVSGLNLQYASTDNPLIPFDAAISMHNASGILLTVNYLIFMIGSLVTGNFKQYFGGIVRQIKNSKLQADYYLRGIFKNENHPFEITKEKKFNPLQQLTYLNIMWVLMPVIIITGWALLFPSIIIEDFFGSSGLMWTALLHTATGFVLSLFMIGHIYLATTGHRVSSNFKSMVNGWHEIEDKH